MRLLDSRRLFGPNLLTRGPAALVEVAFDPGEDAGRAIAAWAEEARRLAVAAEVPFEWPLHRLFAGGAALAFDSRIDTLLAATDVNDRAVESATEVAAGRAPLPLEPWLAEVRGKVAEQRRPRLVELEREAQTRGLPFLWDDEQVSLGHAGRGRSWPIEALPAPAQVPWAQLGRIPVALITGTNGKTTSARLLARIARCAGILPGLASTDAVVIGEELVAEGDYTGPAAARLVLRDPRVQLAVLETARGGILRRGLAVDQADAALITNVADDHLGEYGIDSVAALARAKAVVGTVVPARGGVVLNADDPELVALVSREPQLFAARLIWFSLQEDNPVIAAHVAAGGEAWSVRREQLVRLGKSEEPLARVEEIPITFGGAARHNVANALGVAALASTLGLPRAAIVQGLREFSPSLRDNPGRANLIEVRGVRVLIDFGHNAHGVRQMAALVAALRSAPARNAAGAASAPAGSLSVITGSAGDRSDQNLRALAGEIAAMSPARVLLRELSDYLRGRAPGEVPALLCQAFLELGVPAQAVHLCGSEVEALRLALDLSRPGDFVLVLVHLEAEGVRALLAERGAAGLER